MVNAWLSLRPRAPVYRQARLLAARLAARDSLLQRDIEIDEKGDDVGGAFRQGCHIGRKAGTKRLYVEIGRQLRFQFRLRGNGNCSA
jgi:hypothetical protein